MKLYRNETIERIAERRLGELEAKIGPVGLPIPIDLLGELVLGLDFLWEEIEELPGEIVFGTLQVKERCIVLNEKHRDLFRQRPGLERSTKGHEMGHWDLLIDKDLLDHPELPGLDDGQPNVARRTSLSGDISGALLHEPAVFELVRQIQSRSDRADEARIVNRYAAAISLPRERLREEIAQIDRTRWPDLYRLAGKFDVTISALTVRLQQLDLLHIEGKKLYASRAKAAGQGELF